uniref:Uncharacterized protein n=1 Tax=Lepeophtheirus salmonis TaxID=72036 RepID=A0A0K2U472_LEPSM
MLKIMASDRKKMPRLVFEKPQNRAQGVPRRRQGGGIALGEAQLLREKLCIPAGLYCGTRNTKEQNFLFVVIHLIIFTAK